VGVAVTGAGVAVTDVVGIAAERADPEQAVVTNPAHTTSARQR
jgi:hypothetical protein